MLNYGKRVQYSVFECALESPKIEEMKKKALTFVDETKDSFRIYQICQSCAACIEFYGIKKGWEEQETIII